MKITPILLAGVVIIAFWGYFVVFKEGNGEDIENDAEKWEKLGKVKEGEIGGNKNQERLVEELKGLEREIEEQKRRKKEGEKQIEEQKKLIEEQRRLIEQQQQHFKGVQGQEKKKANPILTEEEQGENKEKDKKLMEQQQQQRELEKRLIEEQKKLIKEQKKEIDEQKQQLEVQKNEIKEKNQKEEIPPALTPLDVLFEQYVKDYHLMLSGKIPPRITVMGCSGGFGNAMISYVSAIMYSLLSKRIFLIGCPNWFPKKYFLERGFLLSVDDVLKDPNIDQEFAGILAKRRGQYGFLPSGLLDQGNEAMIDMFSCEDYLTGQFGSKPILIINTFCYYGSIILEHPLYKDAWAKLAENKQDIPFRIVGFFFEPHPSIMQKFYETPWMKIVEDPNNFAVGMHVRGSEWFPGKGPMVKQWTDCTKQVLKEQQVLLPDLNEGGNPENDTASNSLRPYIYLATDLTENRDIVKSQFPPNLVHFFDYPDFTHNMMAIFVDIISLAYSDALILTPGSTYGYITSLYHQHFKREKIARNQENLLIYRTLSYPDDIKLVMNRFPEIKNLVSEGDVCIKVGGNPCNHDFDAMKPPRCFQGKNLKELFPMDFYKSNSFPFC